MIENYLGGRRCLNTTTTAAADAAAAAMITELRSILDPSFEILELEFQIPPTAYPMKGSKPFFQPESGYPNRMPVSRRSKSLSSLEPTPTKQRKTIPHQFVLEAMADLSPWTRSMFGCLALYVQDKIVLILRDKPGDTDNGAWLATTEEHHESLRREFPTMRSIRVFRKKVTGWQVLPVEAPGFEEAALRACELIVAGDPRIGKVPKARRVRSTVKKSR